MDVTRERISRIQDTTDTTDSFKPSSVLFQRSGFWDGNDVRLPPVQQGGQNDGLQQPPLHSTRRVQVLIGGKFNESEVYCAVPPFILFYFVLLRPQVRYLEDNFGGGGGRHHTHTQPPSP